MRRILWSVAFIGVLFAAGAAQAHGVDECARLAAGPHFPSSNREMTELREKIAAAGFTDIVLGSSYEIERVHACHLEEKVGFSWDSPGTFQARFITTSNGFAIFSQSPYSPGDQRIFSPFAISWDAATPFKKGQLVPEGIYRLVRFVTAAPIIDGDAGDNLRIPLFERVGSLN